VKVGDLIKWKTHKVISSVPHEGTGIIISTSDIQPWRQYPTTKHLYDDTAREQEIIVVTQSPKEHKNTEFVLWDTECTVISEF